MPTVYLDPNSDIFDDTLHVPLGGSGFSKIEDGTRYPSIPDTTDFISGGNGVLHTGTWHGGLTTFSLLTNTVTSVVARVYWNGGGINENPAVLSIFLAGVLKFTGTTHVFSGADEWISDTWNNSDATSLSAADINNLELQIVLGGSDSTAFAYAGYLEVNYTTTPVPVYKAATYRIVKQAGGSSTTSITVILDPTSTYGEYIGHEPIDGSAHERIDGGTRQPSIPSGTEYIFDDGGFGSYAIVGFGPWTKSFTLTSITLWLYIDDIPGDSGSPSVFAQLYGDGDIFADPIGDYVQIPAGSSAGWYSTTYVGDLTQGQLDNLSAYLEPYGDGNVTDVRILEAYVDIRYEFTRQDIPASYSVLSTVTRTLSPAATYRLLVTSSNTPTSAYVISLALTTCSSTLSSSYEVLALGTHAFTKGVAARYLVVSTGTVSENASYKVARSIVHSIACGYAIISVLHISVLGSTGVEIVVNTTELETPPAEAEDLFLKGPASLYLTIDSVLKKLPDSFKAVLRGDSIIYNWSTLTDSGKFLYKQDLK